MELHLKKGEFVKSFFDIALYGGYKPVIGTISPHLPNSKEALQISPAIWFKTFAVRSIFIDCSVHLRDLRWAPLSHAYRILHKFDDAKIVKQKFQRSVFDSGECFDFDISLEDMFDSVSSFVDKLKQKQVKENETGFEVLRLLHCHILPLIMLHKEDAVALQEGHILIDRILQTLEKEINKKTSSLTLLETTLSSQRRRLLRNEGFQREIYIRTCKETFLSELLQHIENDIRLVDVKLEEYQFEVDKAKCEVNPNEEDLAAKRRIRNICHENRQNFCLVRENIRNVLYRPQVKRVHSHKKKILENKFHEIYSELSERLQKVKDEINGLFRNKLRVLSVREAINTTLDELKEVSETTGVQMMSDGTSEMDIFGSESKPVEWQTLNDKVLILVKQNPSILKRHKQFISTLNQIMELSVKEMALFSQPSHLEKELERKASSSSDEIVIEECDDESVEVHLRKPANTNDNSSENRKTRISKSDKVFVDKMGHSSMKNRKSRQVLSHHSNDLGLDRNTRVQSLPIKSAMEAIKRKVNEHMRELIGMLSDNFGEEEPITPNKLWIAYESALHREMLPELSQFYEMAYESVFTSLGKQLSRLSPMNLGITEPWIVAYYDSDLAKFNQTCDVLVDQRETSETEVKYPFVVSGDGSSLERSYDFRKCTVEQLYNIANEDLQSTIDDSFNTAFCDVASTDSRSNSDVFFPSVGGSDNVVILNTLSDSPSNGRNVSPCNFEMHTLTDTCSDSVNDSQYPILVTDNKNMDLWKEFHQNLLQNIDELIKSHTVLSKLKLLTKSIKYIADSVTNLQQLSKTNSDVSCDDLLTLLIVHLIELDSIHRWKLYAHLKLVLDLMPPFLRGSQHDYALVNYYQAFSYLLDYQLLNQRCSSGSMSIF